MDTVQSTEGMVTRKEAARLLKCTERTIRNYQNDGLLNGYHVTGDDKSIYYNEDEIEEVRKTKFGGNVGREDLIDEAAANMAMAPSSIIRAMSEGMRIAQQQVVTLMGPVTESMKMNMGVLSDENKSLRKRVASLEGEIFEFIDLQKKMLREDHEAKMTEITELEAQKMKREAFEKLMGYAPLLATLVGEKLGKSPQAKTAIREGALTDVVDRMSIEQLEALQNSGAFGPPEMAVLIQIKQRLENEKAARLQREAEAAEEEESILNGGKAASEKPGD